MPQYEHDSHRNSCDQAKNAGPKPDIRLSQAENLGALTASLNVTCGKDRSTSPITVIPGGIVGFGAACAVVPTVEMANIANTIDIFRRKGFPNLFVLTVELLRFFMYFPDLIDSLEVRLGKLWIENNGYPQIVNNSNSC